MSRKSSLSLQGMVGSQGIIDAINKLTIATGSNVTYDFADNEVLTGDINGTNKVFTLASTPNPATSLRVYLNGAYQTPAGEDYAFDGIITITFEMAPPEGSIMRAFYRYKNS